MSVASLSGIKYGVYKNIIYDHGATLEDAHYKLKISSKVFNKSYQHCGKFSIHRIEQGSDISPMVWCFISSMLFGCHNQKAHVITLSSPNRVIVVPFSIIGFATDMIKTKCSISCTTTYLGKFKKVETHDFHSLMRKYIKSYLNFHWKQPRKRKRKAGTSRYYISVTYSISTITKSTTGNLSSSNIQGDDSPSFNVMEALNNDSTQSDDEYDSVSTSTTNHEFLTKIIY